jgi:rod shape-determining protein MreC
MDEAIVQHIKRKYNLLIGERTAERIKIQIGNAAPTRTIMTMEVKGRDLVAGIPQDHRRRLRRDPRGPQRADQRHRRRRPHRPRAHPPELAPTSSTRASSSPAAAPSCATSTSSSPTRPASPCRPACRRRTRTSPPTTATLRRQLRALAAVEEENKELRRSLQMRDKVPEDMIAAEISGVEQSPVLPRRQADDRPRQRLRPPRHGRHHRRRRGRPHRPRRRVTTPTSCCSPTPAPRSPSRSPAPAPPASSSALDEDSCTVDIPADFATQVGDFIQTSGVDELFPRGQPVGQVAEVEDVAGDQQRVRVIPAVRFDRLDMVWVVLASAPTPDPGAEQPRKPAAAAGLGPLR